MNTTIAVVETEKRRGIYKRISNISKYQVIHTTPQGLRKVLSKGVEIIITDVTLPDLSNMKILHAIKEEAAKNHIIPVICLSEKNLLNKDIEETIRHYVQRLQTPEYLQSNWHAISIQEIAKGMALPRSELAKMLGISERNLARWVKGETVPKGARDLNLQKLKYIYYLMMRAFKQNTIPKYVREPNPSLRGHTPMMVLLSGDFNSVEADLQQLIEGVYV